MTACSGMENLTITLPEEHVNRIEKLATTLSSRPPRVTVLRAEVMRVCILRGLEMLEAENPQGEAKPR